MDVGFNSETQANKMASMNPLAQPMVSPCLTKSHPISFAAAGLAKPFTLLPDLAESHSQHSLYNNFAFECMGLFEPTPIGQQQQRPAPAIDLNLLQDILNIATEEASNTAEIFNDSTNSMKRKFTSSASLSSLSSKKRRTGEDSPNFRPYQETKWIEQYKELLKFKEEHGHCNVPQSYKPDLGLSRWIKRQRYQYKLRSQGKISTMTEERIQELEKIGFVWDSHAATWDQRFEELKEFRAAYGHCDVPSSFLSNPQLATWVKCQRRQYRLFFQDNALSSITPQRILQLEEVGFKWRVRDTLDEPTPLF